MVSGESLLPGLQVAAVLLCPHMVEGKREGARALVSLLIRAPVHF